MGKDAYYFSHDTNARHDPKISALKADYGIEGYGRFWIIVELLAEQKEYKLKHNSWGIRAIATECQCDIEDVEQFINNCVNELELFKSDGEYFWSQSLNERMKKKDKIIEQKRRAGKKGAKARWNNKSDKTKGKQSNSNANGTAIAKNGKGKETKLKETKLKEKKSNKDLNIMSPSSKIDKIYKPLNNHWKKLIESYIDIYKSKNETNKITDNKHYKLLKEINQIYQEKKFSFDGKEYQLTENTFEDGINTLIEKGIDNMNYAKKIWISNIEKEKDNKPELLKPTIVEGTPEEARFLEWYNEQI